MTGLLSVLIACLIIVLVAAIVPLRRFAQIARIVVILIALLLIIQRLLPLAGISA